MLVVDKFREKTEENLQLLEQKDNRLEKRMVEISNFSL